MTNHNQSFTAQIFRVNAVLGMIILAGQVSRNERAISVTLGTEHGIRAWLKEQEPFVGYTVTDLRGNFDVTHKFGGYATVRSRHNQPITVVEWQ